MSYVTTSGYTYGRERPMPSIPEMGRLGDGYGRQAAENYLRRAGYRTFTPQGWKEAGQEMLGGAVAYQENFARPELSQDTIRGLRQGWTFGRDGVKVSDAATGQYKLTQSKNYGTKFAGNKIADAAESFKPLARAINVIPGLNLLGDVVDIGSAVVGVARRDGVRQGQARDLAQQMAASGMSLDQALQQIESTGGQLESLVGNQGMDDYGKTVANAVWTGAPSLNPIAGLAGLIYAGDLQWEKHRRNQIFKNEFRKAQGI